jgi:hypothetical protein
LDERTTARRAIRAAGTPRALAGYLLAREVTVPESRVRTLSFCAAAALCAIPSVAARADDAPAPAPATPPAAAPPASAVAKIDHPVLDGLVGSWLVGVKGMGIGGAGMSRVRKMAGGTTLVQETQVTAGGRTHFALTLLRLTDGGKGVKVWRTDTSSLPEPTAFQGTLRRDGFDVASEKGETLRFRATTCGFEAGLTRAGETVFASIYTKTPKEVRLDAPNAPRTGHRPSMIGAWDVAGEWTMPGPDGAPATVAVTGTSTFSFTLGGGAMLHEFERAFPGGTTHALGVHRWPADASSTRVWWFEPRQVDPLLADGPTSDAGWTGTGRTADGGEVGLAWAKKGDGFEMRYAMGEKPTGVETYTRRK